MQIRSFRGSGEPVWVSALPSAGVRLGPDPRRALGPAAAPAASTGRTRDRTRPILQIRQNVLARAPSTRDPKRTTLTCQIGGESATPAYGGNKIPAARLARKIAAKGIQVPIRLRNIAKLRSNMGATTTASRKTTRAVIARARSADQIRERAIRERRIEQRQIGAATI